MSRLLKVVTLATSLVMATAATAMASPARAHVVIEVARWPEAVKQLVFRLVH